MGCPCCWSPLINRLTGWWCDVCGWGNDDDDYTAARECEPRGERE